MKKVLFWFFAFIPIIATAVVVKFLPDIVPVHYNFFGEIDRWGSKYEMFITGGYSLLAGILSYVVIIYMDKKSKKTDDDKKKAELQNNIKVIWHTGIGGGVLFTVMQGFIIYKAFDSVNLNIESTFDFNFISIILGVFFIFTGNIMPKVKKNSIIGFRTRWSMANEKSWKASQRADGILCVIMGIVCIINGFVVSKTRVSLTVLVCVFFVLTVLSPVLSYLNYKKYSDD